MLPKIQKKVHWACGRYLKIRYNVDWVMGMLWLCYDIVKISENEYTFLLEDISSYFLSHYDRAFHRKFVWNCYHTFRGWSSQNLMLSLSMTSDKVTFFFFFKGDHWSCRHFCMITGKYCSWQKISQTQNCKFSFIIWAMSIAQRNE